MQRQETLSLVFAHNARMQVHGHLKSAFFCVFVCSRRLASLECTKSLTGLSASIRSALCQLCVFLLVNVFLLYHAGSNDIWMIPLLGTRLHALKHREGGA